MFLDARMSVWMTWKITFKLQSICFCFHSWKPIRAFACTDLLCFTGSSATKTTATAPAPTITLVSIVKCTFYAIHFTKKCVCCVFAPKHKIRKSKIHFTTENTRKWWCCKYAFHLIVHLILIDKFSRLNWQEMCDENLVDLTNELVRQ